MGAPVNFYEIINIGNRLAEVPGLNVIQAHVLNLGAGPGDSFMGKQLLHMPFQSITNVEAFPAYVQKLKQQRWIARSVSNWEGNIADYLRPYSQLSGGKIYDLTLLLDVLEHFEKEEALYLLDVIARITRVATLIWLPIGPAEQGALDGDELQVHRSEWKLTDFARPHYYVDYHPNFHQHFNPPAHAAWVRIQYNED